jgi:hypothetical protein
MNAAWLNTAWMNTAWMNAAWLTTAVSQASRLSRHIPSQEARVRRHVHPKVQR